MRRILTAVKFTRIAGFVLFLAVAGISLVVSRRDGRADFRDDSPGRAHGPASGQRRANTLLAASEANFNFGTLAKGGRRQASFWLYNPGTTTVELSSIRQEILASGQQKGHAVFLIRLKDNTTTEAAVPVRTWGPSQPKVRSRTSDDEKR